MSLLYCCPILIFYLGDKAGSSDYVTSSTIGNLITGMPYNYEFYEGDFPNITCGAGKIISIKGNYGYQNGTIDCKKDRLRKIPNN